MTNIEMTLKKFDEKLKCETDEINESFENMDKDIVESVDKYISFNEAKQTYKEFFKSKLEKYDVGSPNDLDESDKKKFFQEVEDEWTGDKNESVIKTALEELMNKCDKSDDKKKDK